MRNIDSIIVHCSATKAGQDFTATDIDRWHRERGFNGIGYHYVIRLDGKLEKGRDVALAGAHCKGWNEQSIQVLGHRDTSPDLNGDGVIEPYEYVKACPCFDVKEFLRSGRELLFVLLVALVVPVLLSGCRSKKEVINRESEVRVDSSLNSSSGKSLVKNKVASEKDSEVVGEHIEQVLFVFPVDTLGLKVGMVVKTVVDRKNVNEKQLLQEVNSQSVSLSDMSAKTEIHKTGVEKTTNRTTGGWYWYGIILLVLVIVCWICKVKRK